MTRYNLADGGPEEIKGFLCAVVDLAAAHHEGAVPLKRWSGKDLCACYATDWRGIHRQMASHAYNKTRESLMARGKP